MAVYNAVNNPAIYNAVNNQANKPESIYDALTLLDGTDMPTGGVFDALRNRRKDKYENPDASSEEEPEESFRISIIAQALMDKIAGSEGYLSYTRPSTKELFIVGGLPRPFHDMVLGVDRRRMNDGVEGPGLRAESVKDLIGEFKSFDEQMNQLNIMKAPPLPDVFRTPPLPGRVHSGAAAFSPTYTNPADYQSGAALRLPVGRATGYRG